MGVYFSKVEVSWRIFCVQDKGGDDDDYEPGAKKAARKPKAATKKRKASDDDDSDEDWGKRKKVRFCAFRVIVFF